MRVLFLDEMEGILCRHFNNYVVSMKPAVIRCCGMASSIQKYVQLRDALIKEKAQLEARLAEINGALGDGASPVASAEPAAPTKHKPGRKPGRKKKATVAEAGAAPKVVRKKAARKKAGRRAGTRTRSAVPLKETIVKVLEGKLLTRQEVAAGVKEAGYDSSDVLNSVSSTLYQNKAFVQDKKSKKWKLA